MWLTSQINDAWIKASASDRKDEINSLSWIIVSFSVRKILSLYKPCLQVHLVRNNKNIFKNYKFLYAHQEQQTRFYICNF